MSPTNVLSRVLPQFFPRHWLVQPGIVFTEFPSRICIGYVLRSDGAYSYLCEGEFLGLDVTMTELHSAALENLAVLPASSVHIAKWPGGSEGWILAEEDNFTAARILLPQVQQQFIEALGEPFLFSMPFRDDCFCWSQMQPAERQAKHMRNAFEVFLDEEYNLTPDILSFFGGEFRLHKEQPVD